MKPRLYLETTIPSYLTAWPSRDLVIAGHQQVPRDWWQARKNVFDIFISTFVLDEAGAGDPEAASLRLKIIEQLPVLSITDEVETLAKRLLDSQIIPAKAALDASHIAISAVHRLDFLMTWNCTHLANAQIKRKVDRVCQDAGYLCPTICTPEELMGA